MNNNLHLYRALSDKQPEALCSGELVGQRGKTGHKGRKGLGQGQKVADAAKPGARAFAFLYSPNFYARVGARETPNSAPNGVSTKRRI